MQTEESELINGGTSPNKCNDSISLILKLLITHACTHEKLVSG